MTPQLLVIAHTTYVTPLRDEAPFYEITAAPDLATDAPTTVLLTRDEDLYQRALAVEGTEQRVALTWRPATRPNKRACLVLDTLEPFTEEGIVYDPSDVCPGPLPASRQPEQVRPRQGAKDDRLRGSG